MDLIDTSYPLHWPEGWPRHTPRRSQFSRDRKLAEARDFTLGELRKLAAGGVVISSNVRTRRDGLPLSGQAQPLDRGVAVYFRLAKRDQVLACDRWDRVEDNLYAIGMHIAAMRAQDRYGVGTIEQAFRGYTALPPKAPKEPWWQVLGLGRPDPTLVQIEEAYRRLAMSAHPDQGGSDAAMVRLNAARDEGRRTLGDR